MAAVSRPNPFDAVATLNGATLVELMPAVTGRTYHVTKVTLSITTHANAKFAAVQDSAGTPIVVAKHTDATAAASVPSTVTWNFGESGFACTAAKALNAVSESSGVAGLMYVEGYYTV